MRPDYCFLNNSMRPDSFPLQNERNSSTDLSNCGPTPTETDLWGRRSSSLCERPRPDTVHLPAEELAVVADPLAVHLLGVARRPLQTSLARGSPPADAARNDQP